MASSMDVPAMKIIVSNMPPFVSNQQLVSVLSRYGKIVSKISMIPLGCRHDKAMHVMSFRRQLYLIKIGNYDYQVWASSATLTCFLCGAFGHLKRFCPKASCSKCGESGHVDIDCEMEPHRNEKKRMKWFPITTMYFKLYSVVRALQIAVKCLLVLLNRV
uniref:CCHC-type domain-containing protein n=1 Tax=Eptatretus burgeri TaxID=7764 RepID=A0A8C4QZK6_EPTBU